MRSNGKKSDRRLLSSVETPQRESIVGELVTIDVVDHQSDESDTARSFVWQLPQDLSWKHVFLVPLVVFSMLFSFMVSTDVISKVGPLNNWVQLQKETLASAANGLETLALQNEDSLEVVSREGDSICVRSIDGRLLRFHDSQVQIVFDSKRGDDSLGGCDRIIAV